MTTLTCKTNWRIFGAGLASFLLAKASLGQTVSPAQPVISLSSFSLSSSATLQTYQQQQMVLAQSFSAMMMQGGTPQQMAAWQQQNSAVLAAQQQRAIALAAASAAQPMPLIQEVVIPGDASPEMETFLTNQATLANNFAQLHNQNPTTDPTPLFQQQNGTLLQTQTQLSQTLATQAAQIAIPLPPPLQIPPDATPQLAAYLTTRDQLAREQIQLQNQYVAATPAVREAALQQWQQTNASRFQQLQQLAQNLASTTAN